MTKEICICVAILIILIFFNTITQNYTENSIDELTSKLQHFRQKVIDNENDDVLNEDILKIYEEWIERKKILAYYIEHDELEKVETEITAIKGNIQIGEKNNTIADINKSEFILMHIEEKYDLKIESIF